MTAEAREDLNWWVANLPHFKGKALVEQSPTLVILSDTSLSGWGAVCGSATAVGPWTPKDLDTYINELELLGAFHSLRCFAENLRDCSVVLKLDNTTVVFYVNKLEGPRSAPLCDLALSI